MTPIAGIGGAHGALLAVPGDFFNGVSSGADRYLLKHVLHDWDGPRRIEILESIRTAMKPTTKLPPTESPLGLLEAMVA